MSRGRWKTRRIAEALAETRARIAALRPDARAVRFQEWVAQEWTRRPFAEVWQVAMKARAMKVTVAL